MTRLPEKVDALRLAIDRALLRVRVRVRVRVGVRVRLGLGLGLC